MTSMWRSAAVVLIPIVAGAAAWLLHAWGFLQRDVLAGWAEAAGFWAPLMIIVPMIVAVIIGPIPKVPISVASGLVFGPFLGFLYSMFGALIGAAASFWIAREAGRPLAERYNLFHLQDIIRTHQALSVEQSLPSDQQS